MRTIVISGGTDGMGYALARTYLSRGDTVVILGRDPGKGEAFRAAVGGAGERAVFLQADLSLVAENRSGDVTPARRPPEAPPARSRPGRAGR
ncbi:SDR family NAD(P)-dependent oxidoreductase [Actinoallomurus sp. NPDC050550]|uniref:SDR family NAD(P)-dependent oxidoreductase n=1 Tax=Actinoallomurus sp. NPDC050550 TaxID=3154937 RepID=UPI0033CACDBF